jgi:hypothetical protein
MASSKDQKHNVATTNLNAQPNTSNEQSHLLPNQPMYPQYFSISISAQAPSPEDPPLYLENDSTLRERIAQFKQLASSDDHPLPIISYPQSDLSGRTLLNNTTPDPIIKHRQEVVDAYFEAIKTRKDEVVAALIESGVVSPETTGAYGRTPLLAAIEAGHIRTVQQLMDFDADVNSFGIVSGLGPLRWSVSIDNTPKIFRSPLMVAAEAGNLTIVKLLIECYGADDALVAPDGELALRLAASNGHREVVEYLPTRRKGGWKRWQTKHQNAMKRIVRAVKGIEFFFLVIGFEMPKFFLWSVPKHALVLPLWRGAKWMYTHRAELPERIARLLKKIGRALKKVPKELWLFSKGHVQFIWDGIKNSPKAVEIALLWVWSGLQKMGRVVANVFKRFFSFVHTALVAVANFFRTITVKDVWDGFKSFLHSLFVDGPRKVWEWIYAFEEMTLKMLETMWGCTGWLLWILLRAFIGIFMYVPAKLWEILASAAGSTVSACREVSIWIDPKRR